MSGGYNGGPVTLFDALGNKIDSGITTIVGASERGLNARSLLFGFNGSNWDIIKNNSALNLAQATQQNLLGAVGPGQWSVVHEAGTNVQATATKAAGGAGVRHICQAILFSFVNTAAASGVPVVRVRDGASGAGTVLFTAYISIPAVANSCFVIPLSGLNLLGSPNTAMTIEFSAAGGANTVECASMAGYSVL